jgi:superfamily II DNA or RNA helicase
VHNLQIALPRLFDAETRRRADALVANGNVLAVQGTLHDGRLLSKVRGSTGNSYQQVIRISPGQDGTRVDGSCTCPIGFNCKHVAAVLISALDTNSTIASRLAPYSAPAPAPAPALSASRSAPVDTHLQAWLTRLNAPPGGLAPEPNAPMDLVYLFMPGTAPSVRLRLALARRRKDGSHAPPAPHHPSLDTLDRPPRAYREEDRELVGQLLLHGRTNIGDFELRGRTGERSLHLLLASGRCYWGDVNQPRLKLGAERQAALSWRFDSSGRQRPVIDAMPAATCVLALVGPWYVDAGGGEIGPLVTPRRDIASLFAQAPLVAPEQVDQVIAALAQADPNGDLPRPSAPRVVRQRNVVPVPKLRLESLNWYSAMRYFAPYMATAQYLDCAFLSFDYAGHVVQWKTAADIRHFSAGVITEIERKRSFERQCLATLRRLGFSEYASAPLPNDAADKKSPPFVLPDAAEWMRFVEEDLTALRDDGWQIEYGDGFRYRVADIDDWYADVGGSGDWFELELGIQVGAEKIPVAPLLLRLLEQFDDAFSPARLAEMPDAARFLVRLDDGRIVRLDGAKLKPILGTLTELYFSDGGDKVKLARLDAGRLGALREHCGVSLGGNPELLTLAERLTSFTQLHEVEAPQGFTATLRPYQKTGLAWLQFLREFGAAGILADDMGLGKTVQTLAHLLTEKSAGRADRPSLVIAPTSLMHNWRIEAEKFAPALKVLVLQGQNRKRDFDQLASHDLVLSTYPLLARDHETLRGQPYHLLVLDEAQNIKNANSKAARIASSLSARHRLCLTGTPLENHLGELWSIFNFLLPGFLGDSNQFRRQFRTPIEKHQDEFRRGALVRRIKPFLLRRRKDEVATELPPKTEILRAVELRDAQRDLYETIRATMDEKVRAEIARRGIAQSQIVILDALLKLRQVCCDPRLVKAAAARRVEVSAKLELLLDLVPALLDEGRRILLFSQFTSMLALIEPELKQRGIAYALLTGDTVDRRTPIEEFQAGKVGLFLLSLKAGGVGLNLTAADTVIHYDPWWNPAVENQATDRAHRIGQDKPVFVYKLIAAGTVEEKIAALQQRKADLAKAILENGGGAMGQLTQADLQGLFEPLV